MRPMMAYVQLFQGKIPASAKEDLIAWAVQHKNWRFVNILAEGFIPPSLMMKVVSAIHPESLVKILPLLKRGIRDSHPKSFIQLIQKSAKIKSAEKRRQVEHVLKQRCSVFALPILLRKCSIADQKILKAFYAQDRRVVAKKAYAKRRWILEQQKKAKLSSAERKGLVKSYHERDGMVFDVEDMQQFKKQHQLSPNLTWWDFLRQKQTQNKH